ncbi:MAG TPA: helix-turn-helix domain-containing protein [Amycolatopsis sp.]|uniref:helix-turn-helix domain-containing protein n=1 Tax=Amycolatopsis sp. TaxID=37632 RepID=UPI002B4A7FFA|nr:helix-turn-helix domain-containing protein [Amycolatopsis sp.]HKS47369.1 helix-turn-helix domain-containing protein [Amycolatopsis sp.]
MSPKLAYSTEDACEALSIGRTQLFDLLREGEIKSVKIGRRRLIPVDSLREYLDRLLAEQQVKGGGGQAA